MNSDEISNCATILKQIIKKVDMMGDLKTILSIYTNILKGMHNNVYTPSSTSITPLELSNVYISHVN